MVAGRLYDLFDTEVVVAAALAAGGRGEESRETMSDVLEFLDDPEIHLELDERSDPASRNNWVVLSGRAHLLLGRIELARGRLSEATAALRLAILGACGFGVSPRFHAASRPALRT